MAINFPDSPSVNDTYTVGDKTWVWDGTVWGVVVGAVPTTVSELTISNDLTVDTDTLHVDSTNDRVGIGTTTPSRTLDIVQASSGVTPYNLTGGIDIESSNITGLNVMSPNTGYGRIYFGAPVSATAGAVEYIHNATVTNGYMKFRAGGADRLYILGNGNVGINDSTPSYTLDVNGTGRFTGDVIAEGPDGGLVMRNWQASSSYGMIGTVNMASNEYALLTDGVNTYISGGAGGTVHIRGGNNDASPQLTNNGTNVSIDGTVLLDVVSVGNEVQVSNGSASDPSYTFSGDGDTGMYWNQANQIAFTGGNSVGLVVAAGTCSTAGIATSTTSGFQYVLRNNTFGTLYRFTSNRELKENITDVTNSGAIIDALRPVTFIPKFIPSDSTPDDQVDEFDPTVETDEQRTLREGDLNYGFIAEEIALVADGKLAQWEWREDDLVPAGWKWSDVIAVLTAEVKALRGRVALLESAP